MLYEFEAIDGSGERTEFEFPMTDAPPLDSVIEDKDKRKWRRVVSVPSQHREAFKPFASNSAYRHDPLAPRHDKDGRPVFNTKRELAEYERKQRDDPGRKTIFGDHR